MDGKEDIRLCLVGDIAACLKLLDRCCARPLLGDLRIPCTREDDGRPLRLKETLELTAYTHGYGLLHDARRTNCARIAAAMSRVNGDPAPLHARNRREVTIQLIRIVRGLHDLLIILLGLIRLHGRRRLLRFLCRLRLIGARRCCTKVHDNAGLFPVEGKDFPTALFDRSLYHNTNRRSIELRNAHTRNEWRINGDILLCLGYDPCILHVEHDARRVGQHALFIGNSAFGIDDDTDIPIGFSNTNTGDLRHVLCTVTECGFCRNCRTKSDQTDKDYGKQ